MLKEYNYNLLIILLSSTLLFPAVSFSQVIVNENINPERIKDGVVYSYLSSILIDAGPSKCINIEQETRDRAFSNSGPCFEIDGVNMESAEILAKEFQSQEELNNIIPMKSYCEEMTTLSTTGLSRDEFVLGMTSIDNQTALLNSEYFEERGIQILGEQGMDNLIAWANDHIRTSIQSVNFDYANLLDKVGMSATDYVELFCNSIDQIK